MMLICMMMTAMMILIQIEKVPAHCSQEPSELSGLRQVSVRWQMRPPIHRHHHYHHIIIIIAITIAITIAINILATITCFNIKGIDCIIVSIMFTASNSFNFRGISLAKFQVDCAIWSLLLSS